MATKKTPTPKSVTKASIEKPSAKKEVTTTKNVKVTPAKDAKKASVATPKVAAKKKAEIEQPIKKEAMAKKTTVVKPGKKEAVATKAVAKAASKERTAKATKVESKAKAETKAPAKAKATAKPALKSKITEKKPTTPPKKETNEKAPAKKEIVTKTAEKATMKKEPEEKAKKPAKVAVEKTPKAKKEAPVKKVRAKAVFVPAPPMGKSEIVDAVRQKPRKNVSKPGHVIAIRTKEREEIKEEPSLIMEKYNPEQRSVLDDVNEVTGPVYRYSDEELVEFRELITVRLEKARKELNYLQGLITRKDEEGTEDTDNRFNHMEDGSGAMEREQLSQLAGRQVQFISHLENAMVRIENKTYGVCRVTGNLIDKARLRAVPHATLSIEAKNSMRKNG